MTDEDIIRMAEIACNGKPLEYFNGWGVVFDHNQLEVFAALVAAAEREACAQIAFSANTYLEAAAAIRKRGQHD